MGNTSCTIGLADQHCNKEMLFMRMTKEERVTLERPTQYGESWRTRESCWLGTALWRERHKDESSENQTPHNILVLSHCLNVVIIIILILLHHNILCITKILRFLYMSIVLILSSNF